MARCDRHNNYYIMRFSSLLSFTFSYILIFSSVPCPRTQYITVLRPWQPVPSSDGDCKVSVALEHCQHTQSYTHAQYIFFLRWETTFYNPINPLNNESLILQLFINRQMSLSIKCIPSIGVECLVFLLRIREKSGSSLGSKAGYPDWDFFVVFLNSSRQTPE
jgi:hypothetical protein